MLGSYKISQGYGSTVPPKTVKGSSYEVQVLGSYKISQGYGSTIPPKIAKGSSYEVQVLGSHTDQA